jgi:hypothetical protein
MRVQRTMIGVNAVFLPDLKHSLAQKLKWA